MAVSTCIEMKPELSGKETQNIYEYPAWPLNPLECAIEIKWTPSKGDIRDVESLCDEHRARDYNPDVTSEL